MSQHKPDSPREATPPADLATPPTFPRFPLLPAELRDQIWQEAYMASSTARSSLFHPPSDLGGSQWRPVIHWVFRLTRDLRSCFPKDEWAGSYHVPRLPEWPTSEVMAACREARYAAQCLVPQVRIDIDDRDCIEPFGDEEPSLVALEENWFAGAGVILRGVEDVCFSCACPVYDFRSLVDAAAIFRATREFLGAGVKRVALGPEESCSVESIHPRHFRDGEVLVSKRACGRAVAFEPGWNGNLWRRLAVLFPFLAVEVERGYPGSSQATPAILWADLEDATLFSDRAARSYGSGSRWQIFDGSDKDSTPCVDREAIRVYPDGKWEIMWVENAALWANFCPDSATLRLLQLVAVEAAKVWPELQYVSVNVNLVTSDILGKEYEQ
jgi:hypothetical protein